MNTEDQCDSPDVELRLPADPAFAYVLRTTTAAVAARVDFTLDDIEDLKIAVTEAWALLLDGAVHQADLSARFRLGPGLLDVELQLRPSGAFELDQSSFAWQVLTALADHVTCDRTDAEVTLRLSARSSAGVEP